MPIAAAFGAAFFVDFRHLRHGASIGLLVATAAFFSDGGLFFLGFMPAAIGISGEKCDVLFACAAA